MVVVFNVLTSHTTCSSLTQVNLLASKHAACLKDTSAFRADSQSWTEECRGFKHGCPKITFLWWQTLCLWWLAPYSTEETLVINTENPQMLSTTTGSSATNIDLYRGKTVTSRE